MKKRSFQHGYVLAAVASASAIMSSSASAAVFTDSASFNGANPGLSLIDFEGVAADGAFAGGVWDLYSGQGVVFSHPSDIDNNISIIGANGFLGNPSSQLSTTSSNAPILIEFSGQVTSVGFNVSNLDFVQFPALSAGVTIEVFNGVTLLATETFDTATPDLMATFIGFSDLGSDITSVLVTGNTVNDTFGVAQQYIDNLAYGAVPTPSSLALLGLGGLVIGRRRR